MRRRTSLTGFRKIEVTPLSEILATVSVLIRPRQSNNRAKRRRRRVQRSPSINRAHIYVPQRRNQGTHTPDIATQIIQAIDTRLSSPGQVTAPSSCRDAILGGSSICRSMLDLRQTHMRSTAQAKRHRIGAELPCGKGVVPIDTAGWARPRAIYFYSTYPFRRPSNSTSNYFFSISEVTAVCVGAEARRNIYVLVED